MLSYLDRLPGELHLAPRVVLMALRLWAGEVRAGRRPIALLEGLLTRFAMQGALWPAHNFFYWTASHTARPIALGCPCCARVSDDEALILSAVFGGEARVAQAALAALLTPCALGSGVSLAMALSGELQSAAPTEGGGPVTPPG